MGWHQLFDFADGAGFNRFVPLIPEELREGRREGLTVDPSVLWPGGKGVAEIPRDYLQPAYLAQTSLGQYNVRVTPFHLAWWTAALAHEGKMMQPSVVQAITDAAGRVLWQLEPRAFRTVMSPETARQVREMMVEVVETGTGQPARITGLKMAGKTGTPEEDERSTHALFIAWAPAEDPVLAVAVVIEGARGGGRIAGPMAAQLLHAAEKIRRREGERN